MKVYAMQIISSDSYKAVSEKPVETNNVPVKELAALTSKRRVISGVCHPGLFCAGSTRAYNALVYVLVICISNSVTL